MSWKRQEHMDLQRWGEWPSWITISFWPWFCDMPLKSSTFPFLLMLAWGVYVLYIQVALRIPPNKGYLLTLTSYSSGKFHWYANNSNTAHGFWFCLTEICLKPEWTVPKSMKQLFSDSFINLFSHIFTFLQKLKAWKIRREFFVLFDSQRCWMVGWYV